MGPAGMSASIKPRLFRTLLQFSITTVGQLAEIVLLCRYLAESNPRRTGIKGYVAYRRHVLKELTERLANRKATIQCDIRTGIEAFFSRSRVAPPNISSKSGEWP